MMNNKSLSALVDQVRGVSYKPKDIHDTLNDLSIVLLRANNIFDGSVDFSDVIYIDRKRVSPSQILRRGDILVCASSGSKDLVGKAASFNCDGEYTFGAFCKVVRPKNVDDADYISMFFQSPKYRREIAASALGANINNIRNEHIDNLIINWPVKLNRDIIVSLLNQSKSIITLRKKQLQLFDELIKARFVEMFGNPVVGDRIKGNKHKIGDFASVTKLAGFEFTKYIKYKDSGDIIMLRGLNCKKGHLVLDDIKWIDQKTSDLLPRSKLYYGDILMTYAGTIGDVAMVDADNKYHLAPNVGKITIEDKENFNPIYLIHLFMYTHDYIMSFASQVAQASINMEKIRNFEYYFPNIEAQNRFEVFVKQVDKSKVAVQKSLEQTQILFDSLMQQYFG